MPELQRHWIGGQWVASDGGTVIEVISPSSGQPIGTVVTGTAADTESAIKAARTSFDDGRWSRVPVAERAAVIDKARAILVDKVDEITQTVTGEMGAPVTYAAGQVRNAVQGYMADAVARAPRLFEPFLVRDPKGTSLVYREPLGVVGAIAPWNGPYSIGLAKIIPALVAGCSVVFKPAPQTPFDIHYLVQALTDAGLPPGVLNVVTGDLEVGTTLVTHPAVDAVTFTGSTAAGRSIAQACGAGLKHVTLELGGKSAAIVLDDVDIAAAAKPLAKGMTSNSGQACVLLSRVLVPRRRHDEIVDALTDAVAGLRLGDPFDPATDLGPLITAAHRDRVESYIALGKAEGATVHYGGDRPEDLPEGYYLRPTIFTGATNSMRIAQEEIFGPVTAVIAYDTVEEAVALANDSEYGLHGAVFTTDVRRGLDLAARVRTGTFAVNGYGFGVASPFGGYKASGLGREHGDEGVIANTEYKAIMLPDDAGDGLDLLNP